MGKYIDKNWKDLCRLLKLVITQLLFLIPLSIYYRTELLMSTNLIAGELIKINKKLSSNFTLSSDLVGNVADKFIILLVIVCFITSFSSIYSSLTLDQFVIAGWNMVVNILIGIAAVIIPISGNQISYESETITLICFIVLLSSLIPFLLFRLFGYLITFVFFNSKIHSEDFEEDKEFEDGSELESEENEEDFDEEDSDEVVDSFVESDHSDDGSHKTSNRKKNKKMNRKRQSSYYEDFGGSSLSLDGTNRVSIFKR